MHRQGGNLRWNYTSYTSITFPGAGDWFLDLLPNVGVEGFDRILDNEEDLDFGLGIDILNPARYPHLSCLVVIFLLDVSKENMYAFWPVCLH